MASVGAVIPPLKDRPMKGVIYLFDVDETLTPARLHASPEMLTLLSTIRQRVAIGYVGGSDLSKQQEQLGTPSIPVQSLFDYCFPENGLTAFRMGVPLESANFISWLGEEKYKKFVRFCLRYIADLADEIPIVRGTFIEFRNGMVNVSPVGRNASTEERKEFTKFDDEHHVREKFVKALREEFPDFGLTYSIGGQISFDVFPTGWDKTYCLRHVENDQNLPDGVDYHEIHFFGDKTSKGGNDYEIYEDSRTIGHNVKGPEDTMAQLKEIFKL
ncbi:eukaryotic phosphomannomutase [Tothia fuscella]|uniref:Phosphomannomutase n=1 Tax=Tothia fuscella TaxID=1048955 RepID=A0A9P4P1N2_9PEZI|nr:eukaryotic phosphomannomutase [Tothia fuscella]